MRPFLHVRQMAVVVIPLVSRGKELTGLCLVLRSVLFAIHDGKTRKSRTRPAMTAPRSPHTTRWPFSVSGAVHKYLTASCSHGTSRQLLPEHTHVAAELGCLVPW